MQIFNICFKSFGGAIIKEKLLILPGFIIGIICLMIITYRTIIAFLDENKIITININKYGEQYFDIAAIVIIWLIYLISLFFLIKSLGKDVFSKQDSSRLQKEPILNKQEYFFDLNSKIKLNNKRQAFIGYISSSYKKVKQKFKEK